MWQWLSTSLTLGSDTISRHGPIILGLDVRRGLWPDLPGRDVLGAVHPSGTRRNAPRPRQPAAAQDPRRPGSLRRFPAQIRRGPSAGPAAEPPSRPWLPPRPGPPPPAPPREAGYAAERPRARARSRPGPPPGSGGRGSAPRP